MFSLSGELMLLCTYLQKSPGGRNSGLLCVKGKFAGLPSSLLYFSSSECVLKLCGSMKVFFQYWEYAGLFLMTMRAHRIPPTDEEAEPEEILLQVTVTSIKVV